MNEILNDLLQGLDDSDGLISEYKIYGKLNSIKDDEDSFELRSERMAFAFSENNEDRDVGWGTFYGPMSILVGDDGHTYENPSLTLVNEEMLNYWSERSEKTNNLIMKARYCGLVWDLTNKVMGRRPDHKVAIEYINTLIKICDYDLCEHSFNTIKKITRAYKVACTINNKQLKETTITSAINLEDRIADDNKAGLWGFCFELFVLGKEKNMTEAQKNKIITDLESRLVRISKNESPWECESAGIPLATYYRANNQLEDVRRIIEVVGLCFESSCAKSAPIQASTMYQKIHDIYISFNLKDKADAVLMKISEVGADLVDSMQTFSHSVEIPKEDLDAYLLNMVKGGLDNALNRIAVQFIPKKEQIEQQVLELAKEHPLSFLFKKTFHDHKGRPVAAIQGIEDDLEGHVIQQLSQNMEIDSFFLRHSFNKVFEVYSPSCDELLTYILLSPIFEETKKPLIERGIKAFLEEDYITTIHLLIPQTEAAIRTIVESSGGAVLKKNRQGGLQLLTFDALLRSEQVLKCFGKDITFYFRVLLTDQRGWNLRNDVCHGLSPGNRFNKITADRIMHVLLCLSKAREQ